MNISPRDILDKEFSRKMRGYDPGEVDEFLDEIIKQFESLIEENENVVAKNAELKSELGRLRAAGSQTAQEKAQPQQKQEALDDRLLAMVLGAQRSANLYLERAESQAAKIMEMANANARAMMESAHIRLETVQQEMTKYERVIEDYKRQFRRLVEQQAAYMDTHTLSTERLESTRREVDEAVSRVEAQMRDLDRAPQPSARQYEEDEPDPEEMEYSFPEPSAEGLQELVDDILED